MDGGDTKPATKAIAKKIRRMLTLDALKHKIFGEPLITIVIEEDVAKAFLAEQGEPQYER